MFERLLGRTKALEKAMDATWLRNEAIAQNIANVDTPNYKKKTVSFEDVLSDAINENKIKGLRTDKRHIPINPDSPDDIAIKVTEDKKNLSIRLDGNNVDMDTEMADLAKNNIRYSVLTQSISGSFRKLKSVISEGRR